eukprot:3228361-Amphidinium_carterae.1
MRTPLQSALRTNEVWRRMLAALKNDEYVMMSVPMVLKKQMPSQAQPIHKNHSEGMSFCSQCFKTHLHLDKLAFGFCHEARRQVRSTGFKGKT